jgi:hypothetical protein
MRPFEGIRVLDFTHVYAGPFATFQLAVMGAEVIKIEAPGKPDQIRLEGVDEALNEQGLGTSYVFNNQGKKAISLNLDSDEGHQIAVQLIESADVLVENYPGTMAKYGLSPEQALAINPLLIYCEMTGFGRDNPFAGRPAYDPVIQAASGMMSLNGTADQEFLRVGPPLIDYGMGAQTAFAIACALYQRNLSGKGQVIEANMLDAALVMMSPLVANAIHAGETEQRTGNVQIDRPGYGVYPCNDDNLMIGAFTLEHQISTVSGCVKMALSCVRKCCNVSRTKLLMNGKACSMTRMCRLQGSGIYTKCWNRNSCSDRSIASLRGCQINLTPPRLRHFVLQIMVPTSINVVRATAKTMPQFFQNSAMTLTPSRRSVVKE